MRTHKSYWRVNLNFPYVIRGKVFKSLLIFSLSAFYVVRFYFDTQKILVDVANSIISKERTDCIFQQIWDQQTVENIQQKFDEVAIERKFAEKQIDIALKLTKKIVLEGLIPELNYTVIDSFTHPQNEQQFNVWRDKFLAGVTDDTANLFTNLFINDPVLTKLSEMFEFSAFEALKRQKVLDTGLDTGYEVINSKNVQKYFVNQSFKFWGYFKADLKYLRLDEFHQHFELNGKVKSL